MENNGLGGKSIILRLEMNTQEIKFGQVASAIFEAGGDDRTRRNHRSGKKLAHQSPVPFL